MIVRGDFRQLDKLDIAGQGLILPSIPAVKLPGTDNNDMQRIVRLAVDGNPQLAALVQSLIAASGGTFAQLQKPVNVPVGLTPSDAGVFTMAVGFQGAAFAVIGATIGFGLYGSTSPELGVFFSLGGGWWTNVGLSAGVALTFIFGPPSALAGVSWGIGCDVRFMVGSAGGLLLFTPPPFRFLGFCVGLGVGPSAIPALDVTLQVSDTFIKPLLQ